MANGTKKVITPNEAVKAAADYFTNAVGTINADTKLALEELEMSSDRKHWLVTLSHRDPTASPVYTLYPGSDTKLFKVFTIDAYTGDVLSMKAKKV